MYKIIGADGQEYGPYTIEQLRDWLNEGRLNCETPVRAESSPDWLPLGSLPEFGAAAAPTPSPSRPAPVAASARRAPTSKLSLASLACGLLGALLWFTALRGVKPGPGRPMLGPHGFAFVGLLVGALLLAGLLSGLIALANILNGNRRLKGSGFALAGTAVSGGVLVLIVLLFAPLWMPASLRGRSHRPPPNDCASNAVKLSVAVKVYAFDHNGRLPSPATWCDDIRKDVADEHFFRCPAAPDARCGFAFNQTLAGKRTTDVNPKTVLLFDSDLGWNGSGGLPQAATNRHAQRVVVVLVDGELYRVPVSKLDTLRWEP